MMPEDFTPDELALVESIEKREPVQYGKRRIEISYESGKRVHSEITVTRSISEKHRTKHCPDRV